MATAQDVALIRTQGEVDNPSPWKTVAGIGAISAAVALIISATNQD